MCRQLSKYHLRCRICIREGITGIFLFILGTYTRCQLQQPKLVKFFSTTEREKGSLLESQWSIEGYLPSTGDSGMYFARRYFYTSNKGNRVLATRQTFFLDHQANIYYQFSPQREFLYLQMALHMINCNARYTHYSEHSFRCCSWRNDDSSILKNVRCTVLGVLQNK
jgi:hypothetical protein